MPSRFQVEALISTVEAGRFIEAREIFYATDATARENMDGPALLHLTKKEESILGQCRVTARRGITYVLDGDRVVINWAFEFERHDGSRFIINELAYQLWSGEQVVEEWFYYDPTQRDEHESRQR